MKLPCIPIQDKNHSMNQTVKPNEDFITALGPEPGRFQHLSPVFNTYHPFSTLPLFSTPLPVSKTTTVFNTPSPVFITYYPFSTHYHLFPPTTCFQHLSPFLTHYYHRFQQPPPVFNNYHPFPTHYHLSPPHRLF
jgi:hypothetical protein